MDALVTSAQYPAVAAGIRALGRAGVRVLALAPRRTAAGIWSRYATATAVAPAPEAEPSGFMDLVGQLAQERGPLVIYPGCDDAIEATLRLRAALPASARLPYPPDAAAKIRDKRQLPQLARSVGLQAPATIACAFGGELIESRVPFPCIVKPTRDMSPRWRAHLVRSASHLVRLLASDGLPADEPLLAQEYLGGPLTSLELVVAPDGSVAGRFQQLARRTSPSGAGLIRASVSVHPDEGLVARATRMLNEAGYWGMAQLDLIETATGFAVLDINPRFYSCMPLSLACGVNLPSAWHAVAAGLPAPRVEAYREGLGFRWLEGELVEAIKGRPRWRIGADSRRRAGAIWARDDPVPSVVLAFEGLAGRARGLFARFSGQRRAQI